MGRRPRGSGRRPAALGADAVTDDGVKAHFGAELAAACWAAFAAKRLDAERAEALNARLAERWEAMRACLSHVMRPAAKLHAVLARAGAPTTPGDLHWPRPFYGEAVRHPREIRNRYTFLDLAADSGMLDDAEII